VVVKIGYVAADWFYVVVGQSYVVDRIGYEVIIGSSVCWLLILDMKRKPILIGFPIYCSILYLVDFLYPLFPTFIF